MHVPKLLLSVLVLPGMLLAGCVSTPEAVDPAASIPSDTESATSLAPFTFEGVIPPHYSGCASWAVGYGCLTLPPQDVMTRHAVEADGTPTAFSVTATWDPSVPMNQELVLYAMMHDGEDWEALGWKMGASPLTWEEDVEVPEGYTLEIGLLTPSYGMGANNVGGYARGNAMEQPYALEGWVTVAPRS